MPLKLKRHEAEHQAEEEQSWSCLTCDKLVEDSDTDGYCFRCRMYWEDVQAGVFDHD